MNLLFDGDKLTLNHLPDLNGVDTIILMNQHISESGQAAPRDGRVGRSIRFGKPFGGLSDDFKVADHRILNESIGEKPLSASIRIGNDPINAFQNLRNGNAGDLSSQRNGLFQDSAAQKPINGGFGENVDLPAEKSLQLFL